MRVSEGVVVAEGGGCRVTVLKLMSPNLVHDERVEKLSNGSLK